MANTKVNTKAEETVLTPQEIQRQRDMEKIQYVAKRPVTESIEVDDVTVSLNGKNYQIKYGEPVMIPRAVADILDNTYLESEKLHKRITQLGKEQNLFEG